MGWISNIIAGLVGSWLCKSLLGSLDPHIANMAIILVIVASAVFGIWKKIQIKKKHKEERTTVKFIVLFLSVIKIVK